MRCENCQSDISIGFEEAPGTFLAIVVAAATVAAATGLLLWLGVAPGWTLAWQIACFIGLGTLVYGGGALYTSMGDARTPAADGRAPGRRCRACGHVSRIRPWSR